MILVTVGTQLGFDRLIRAMDELATNLSVPVVAQIGSTAYIPKNMAAQPVVDPAEFEDLVRASALIVGHAGTGTILTAAKFRKPVVLMPRKASLGEHRNDHQMATAHAFSDREGIYVAWDEKDLESSILRAMRQTSLSDQESDSLVQLRRAVREFLTRWAADV